MTSRDLSQYAAPDLRRVQRQVVGSALWVLGPVTEEHLAARTEMSLMDVRRALHALNSAGKVRYQHDGRWVRLRPSWGALRGR